MTLIELPDVEQRSAEWYDQRRGMVTASAVGQLISVGPPDARAIACPTCNAVAGGFCISTARKVPTQIKTIHDARTALASVLPDIYAPADNDTSRGLTALLVAERITGYTDPTFTNDDMWRGITAEPLAVEKYVEHYAPVRTTGFMIEDRWGFSIGYSPDGLVGDDGLIEVKCPRAKTHIRTILADQVPAHYMPQLQCGLLVSGRSWIDFISYSGGLPMWTKRVEPDQRWADAIVAAVQKFEDNAAEMVAKYRTATQGLPATERVIELEMSL